MLSCSDSRVGVEISPYQKGGKGFTHTLRCCLELLHRIGLEGKANVIRKEGGKRLTMHLQCEVCGDTSRNIASWIKTSVGDSSLPIAALRAISVRCRNPSQLGGKARPPGEVRAWALSSQRRGVSLFPVAPALPTAGARSTYSRSLQFPPLSVSPTQSLRKEFCRSHSCTQMLPRTGCTNEPVALLKAPCCAPNCFAWQRLQCYDALVFL